MFNRPPNAFLSLAFITTVISLTGCAKSVDHYVQEEGERNKTLMKCLVDSSDFKSGDCGNAKLAQDKIDEALRAKRKAEREAEMAKREAEAAKQAEVDAERRAQLQAKMSEASARFKAVEEQERQKFKQLDEKVAALTPQAINSKLMVMATELNKGNIEAAARAIHVPTIELGALQQHAMVYKGFANVSTQAFSATPAKFEFTLTVGPDRVPTGYTLNAENTKVEVSVISEWIAQPCLSAATLKYSINKTTGELVGELSRVGLTVREAVDYLKCRR